MWAIVLGVVLGAAIGAALWVLALVGEASNSPEVYRSSPHYEQVIAEYGYPHTWWLADGPNTDGGQPIRAERWFYPELGVSVFFLDGWRGEEQDWTPEPGASGSFTDVTPTDLNRSMTRDEVDVVIGTLSEYAGEVSTKIGTTETWVYADAGLIVQFLDGHFFGAQTVEAGG